MSTYVLVITQKIWDSGLALASYLTQHLTSGAASHSSLADDASRYPAGQQEFQEHERLSNSPGAELFL